MKYKHELLLIDVSNSYTKLAASNGKEIGEIFPRIKTGKLNGRRVQNLLRKLRPRILVLSSVAPKKTKLLIKAAKLYRSRVIEINTELELDFAIKYPKPEQLGADRICNAAAAQMRGKFPCVVVDFGTAVTFDVIDAEGAYVGGIICPGLESVSRYMREKTALLPKVSLREPDGVIGKSTRHAMRSGLVIGYRGMIAELIGRIKDELASSELFVYATGGYAELIAQKLPLIDEISNDFTLRGALAIALKNLPKDDKN